MPTGLVDDVLRGLGLERKSGTRKRERSLRHQSGLAGGSSNASMLSSHSAADALGGAAAPLAEQADGAMPVEVG